MCVAMGGDLAYRVGEVERLANSIGSSMRSFYNWCLFKLGLTIAFDANKS